MEGFREGAEKKAKQFRPKNPSRLTVAELEEFLALSEEEEDLDGSDGCDISDMMDCDISDEDDSWLLRDSTPPPPSPLHASSSHVFPIASTSTREPLPPTPSQHVLI